MFQSVALSGLITILIPLALWSIIFPRRLLLLMQTAIDPSTSRNGSGCTDKTFMYVPLGSLKRLILFVLFVSVGVIGLVGNILVLCFLKSKAKTAPFAKAWSFENNCDVYIKSLAISDVLCTVISLPPVCIQLYFDVFNQGWSCNIVRYLNIVFTSITMNNLLFFNIERFMIFAEFFVILVSPLWKGW